MTLAGSFYPRPPGSRRCGQGDPSRRAHLALALRFGDFRGETFLPCPPGARGSGNRRASRRADLPAFSASSLRDRRGCQGRSAQYFVELFPQGFDPLLEVCCTTQLLRC